MKKKLTYKDALELNIQANAWLLEKDFLELKEGAKNLTWTSKKPTKLSAALKNIMKQLDVIINEFNEEVDELRINNALTDPKTKALLKEANGESYQFSPEGLIAFKKAIKELQKTEIEINVRIQSEETVDLDAYNQFNGVVVTEVEIAE